MHVLECGCGERVAIEPDRGTVALFYALTPCVLFTCWRMKSGACTVQTKNNGAMWFTMPRVPSWRLQKTAGSPMQYRRCRCYEQVYQRVRTFHVEPGLCVSFHTPHHTPIPFQHHVGQPQAGCLLQDERATRTAGPCLQPNI